MERSTDRDKIEKKFFYIHRLQGIIPTKYHIFEEDGHDDAMRKFIGKLTG